MSDKIILNIDSELGAGTRGASMGYEALRVAAWNKPSDFFKRHKIQHVHNRNDKLHRSPVSPYAKYINLIAEQYEIVCKEVDAVLAKPAFPLVISGDHSNAGGVISGIRKHFPNKRLGIIWIDAHSDMHSPYTTPSGNVHGMPLAAMLGEDNIPNQVNNIEQDTARHWEQLKKTGGKAPKVMAEDIVMIAARDIESQERVLMDKYRVRNFEVQKVRDQGTDTIARQALQLLTHCDLLYLSFDVDSLDVSISEGTGTPVPNGLTKGEATSLLHRLMQDDKVCAFEIAEINPALDYRNRMAKCALDILEEVFRK